MKFLRNLLACLAIVLGLLVTIASEPPTPPLPSCIDSDGDGYISNSATCKDPGLDCDDNNLNVNPGVTENLGNGIDDDCNPATPDNSSATGYTITGTGGMDGGAGSMMNSTYDFAGTGVIDGDVFTMYLENTMVTILGTAVFSYHVILDVTNGEGTIETTACDGPAMVCGDQVGAVNDYIISNWDESVAGVISWDNNVYDVKVSGVGTADSLAAMKATEEATEIVCTDSDSDGFAIEGGVCGKVDCDDTDGTVNPDVTEIIGNGKDDDCNPATPDSPSEIDDDGDGVADSADQCPNTSTGETVDANGCSASQLDSDGDGVADSVDQCANTPTSETVDANGCSSSQIDSGDDGMPVQAATNYTITGTGGMDGGEDSMANSTYDFVGTGVIDGVVFTMDLENTMVTLLGTAVMSSNVILDVTTGEGTIEIMACEGPAMVCDGQVGSVSDYIVSNWDDSVAGVITWDNNIYDIEVPGVGTVDSLASMKATEDATEIVCTDDDSDGFAVEGGACGSIDQCPNTPTGETVDEKGCSSSQIDSDGMPVQAATNYTITGTGGMDGGEDSMANSTYDFVGTGVIDGDVFTMDLENTMVTLLGTAVMSYNVILAVTTEEGTIETTACEGPAMVCDGQVGNVSDYIVSNWDDSVAGVITWDNNIYDIEVPGVGTVDSLASMKATEEATEIVCTDSDSDGFAVEGGVCGEVDCDDTDDTVNPDVAEIPGNGKDNDCNPATPDSSAETDDDGDSTCCSSRCFILTLF